MDTLWRELRLTLRRLTRSPTTSLSAVVTMALGIGVATGAYSIMDGLMLRGVSFEDAESLVALRSINLRSGVWDADVPEQDFADWRDHQESFEALIGFHCGTVTLRDDPVTFSAVPLFLLAVSLLAHAIPARRAARVDPVEVLRRE